MSELLSAEQIVNAYAAAFYRALSPELARAMAERVEGRAQGISPGRLSTLYRVDFSDIQRPVYRWLTTAKADPLGARIQALPGLTYDPQRATPYEERKAVHEIELVGLAPFSAVEWKLKIVELLYLLLEVFNNSHSLTMREQTTIPASIAALLQDGAEQFKCLENCGMPQTAAGVSPAAIYDGCSIQPGGNAFYPRSLWQHIEA